MYKNWQIKKSIINYSGQDEQKKEQAKNAQEEYTKVAEWCNESNQYHIEDIDNYYAVVKNSEQTEEERKEIEISELKDYLSATDYVVIKIAEGSATSAEYADVLDNRKKARKRINELENDIVNLN